VVCFPGRQPLGELHVELATDCLDRTFVMVGQLRGVLVRPVNRTLSARRRLR
jgi:hypothetical protein